MRKPSLQPELSKSTSIFQRHRKFTKLVLIFLVVILFLIFGVPVISNLYNRVRDTYALRQPVWAEYNKEDTSPGFVLAKMAYKLVPSTVEETQAYFFRNRLSLNGGVTKAEECVKTKYKCGNEGWQDFDSAYTVLENKCIVRVEPNTYCNIILPGGSLISAINAEDGYDLMNNLFSEQGLLVQIETTATEVIVRQNVTKQESTLWHIVVSGEKKYAVEVGDQTVTATGTEFYTTTSSDNGLVSGVRQGSTVYSGYINPVTLSTGSFAQAPAFNTAACPATLKKCGTSCIPANGVCCDTNSYCLSPVQCQSNNEQKCKSNQFLGGPSEYCCSNNSAAEQASFFAKGSYDCQQGYKFCGMSCISNESICCYPTDNDCPVKVEDTNIVVDSISSQAAFPRQYFYDLYKSILPDATYLGYTANLETFMNENKLKEMYKYMEDKLAASAATDYANSDSTKEKTAFCNRYPDFCATTSKKKTTSSGSNTSSDKCFYVIKVDSCTPKSQDKRCNSSQRLCWYSYTNKSGGYGGYGQGCIPSECAN